MCVVISRCCSISALTTRRMQWRAWASEVINDKRDDCRTESACHRSNEDKMSDSIEIQWNGKLINRSEIRRLISLFHLVSFSPVFVAEHNTTPYGHLWKSIHKFDSCGVSCATHNYWYHLHLVGLASGQKFEYCISIEHWWMNVQSFTHTHTHINQHEYWLIRFSVNFFEKKISNERSFTSEKSICLHYTHPAYCCMSASPWVPFDNYTFENLLIGWQLSKWHYYFWFISGIYATCTQDLFPN